MFQYFEVDPFENTSRGTRPVFSICIEAIVQTEEMPESDALYGMYDLSLFAKQRKEPRFAPDDVTAVKCQSCHLDHHLANERKVAAVVLSPTSYETSRYVAYH